MAGDVSFQIGMSYFESEAARDHAGHFRRVRDRRPHVVLKLAVSSDDKIGAAGHKPVAISGEAAKARVQSDAAWYRAITGMDPPKHQPYRRR